MKYRVLAAFSLPFFIVPFFHSGVLAQSTGLVAAYNFNEGTGNLLVDLSGNNNGGTISGATWTTQGKYSGALTFDGVNDIVSVADSNSLDLKNALTLEAWVKPTANSGWRTIVMKETAGNLVYGMYSNTNTNRPSGEIAVATNTDVRGTAAMALNTWTHVTVTYDGATLRYFVNGTQVRTKAVTGLMQTSSSPLKIGGNTIWGEYFKGSVDDIRIYNRVLSQAEIQTDMNTPVVVQPTSPKLTITSPQSGATISGVTVNVTYTTSGNSPEANHAHFRLDNGSTRMDLDFDGQYTFTDVAPGSHSLVGVIARSDHTEITGSEHTVNFTTAAPDTVAPTVSITNPSVGAQVSGNTTISASASDNVAVTGVQFKIDGANIGSEDTAAPYSVNWNSTSVSNGQHAITAVARDAANNSTASQAVNVTVANVDSRAVVGEWGSLMNWPLVAVHTTLLPTGKILLWDAWEYGTTQAKVWDPKTNTFSNASVEDQLFCSAHAMLADGKLLVSGGHNGGEIGIKSTYTFDQNNNSWTKAADMRAERWYATNTTLGDGRVLALGGQISSDVWNDTPEVYNPTNNSWTALAVNTNSLHDKQYHLPFLLPNGTVYSFAVSQGTTHILNVANQTWTNSINIPMRFGSAAMYKPGKILYSGGSNSYSGSNAQPNAYVVDMSQQSPSFRQIASMSYPRYQHNLTMLPDGNVLAIGGADILDQQAQTGIKPAEIWDATTETWTTVASMQDLRMYHATSLLLPDGRVLSAGGGRLNSAANYLTAQIYSPPYLFKGARPTISLSPQTTGYNQTIAVQSPQAQEISKVSFIPLASVTHTIDFNQRFLELNFTKNGNDLSVTTPSNGNMAPPGYYMLFIVNAQGVPSEAAIIKLGSTTGPTPTPSGTPTPTITPMPSPTGAPAPLTITFDDKPGQDQVLNGQHPQNIIEWGNNLWWHSAPWGKFTTKSISFNSPASTAETFSFITPKKLVSVQAYNGGGQTTVTLSCSGQPNKQVSVAADTVATIATGWGQACTTVSVSSTNGWYTNFDSFVIE